MDTSLRGRGLITLFFLGLVSSLLGCGADGRCHSSGGDDDMDDDGPVSGTQPSNGFKDLFCGIVVQFLGE